MIDVLTFVTALGCGIGAGAFFAFSSFVMPALRRLPAEQGIAAMQSINITAVTPVFMIQFVGTAVLSLAVIIVAIADWGEPSWYLIAGGLFYLLGTFMLTMAYNVPRNNALARLDPHDPGAPSAWARYVREWTAANHVRTVAGVAAAALLLA
jgi:uncharacterized membrane protein